MIKILVFLLIMSNSLISQNNEYTVLLKNDLFEISKKNDGELIEQIQHNLAYVKFLEKTKEYAVFPQKGKYGVLFKNEEILRKCIDKREFPVEYETDSFFEKDKTRIFNIDSTIEEFLEEFKNILDIENFVFNTKEVNSLSKKINKVYKSQIENKERLSYLSGYYMMYLMYYHNSDKVFYKLDLENTLNQYWIPNLGIKDSNKKISFWKIIEENIGTSNFDLKEFYLFEKAKVLGIRVLSKDHAKLLKSEFIEQENK